LQRLQARNPAATHASTEGSNRQFSRFGFRAGQVSRQKIPVEVTQTKATPAMAASRSSSAV
jgi:hypothetical protein